MATSAVARRRRSLSAVALRRVHNRELLQQPRSRSMSSSSPWRQPQRCQSEMSDASTKSANAVSGLIRSLHRGKKAFSNKRLIHKNGEFNISQKGIKKRKQQYLADIFTTLIDLKWRWTLLMFTMAFLVSWFFFGLIWWVISYVKQDIANVQDEEWPRCIIGIDGFVSAVLFSIETQHTIGYGTRSITKNCPEALVTLMIQATFGVIIQALMTGLIFAKLARPKKRAETLMFSKRACICKRDNQLVLLMRVGDMRSSHIIGAHMDALLIRRRVTLEGEVIPLETENIDLGCANNRLLLRWPVIIEHRINENSPLWSLSKDDLERENFEIFVILEGSVPSTGASTQAMTSYLPEEISWGHRFERLVTNQRDDGKYLFDYTRFHATVAVETPICSAAELSKTMSATNSRRPSICIPPAEQSPRTPSAIECLTHTVGLNQWLGEPVRFSLTDEQNNLDISGQHTDFTVQRCQDTQTPTAQEQEESVLNISNPSSSLNSQVQPEASSSRQDSDDDGFILVRVNCKEVQVDSPQTLRLRQLSSLIKDGKASIVETYKSTNKSPKLLNGHANFGYKGDNDDEESMVRQSPTHTIISQDSCIVEIEDDGIIEQHLKTS